MKDQKISQWKLAVMMRTSRTQVARALYPADGNVTMETLQLAAAVLRRKVQIGLL